MPRTGVDIGLLEGLGNGKCLLVRSQCHQTRRLTDDTAGRSLSESIAVTLEPDRPGMLPEHRVNQAPIQLATCALSIKRIHAGYSGLKGRNLGKRIRSESPEHSFPGMCKRHK